MLNHYFCIRQFDTTDCGVACIATIAKHYGKKISLSKIREYAGTDKQGTNIYGISLAVEKLGFEVNEVKGSKDALFSNIPLPCIAHVVVNGSLLHYVVIYKITKKKIIIADPATGLIKVTPDEFFGFDKSKYDYCWTGIFIFMKPNENFSMVEEEESLLKRLFILLKPQKKLMLKIFLISLVITVIGLSGAFYYKILLDYIIAKGLKETLNYVSVGFILIIILRIALSIIRSQLMIYFSQHLDINLLLGYCSHILKLPLKFFQFRKTGEIITRFTDASKIRDVISNIALTLMIDIIMAISGGLFLYIQNRFMFFTTLFIVFNYIIIIVFFRKSFVHYNKQMMENNADLTSYIVESINGIQTLKAYNGEKKTENETENKFVKLLKSILKLTFIGNIQSNLLQLIELLGGIVILWSGAYFVLKGRLSVGQLITYNSLLIYFIDPVKNLINLQPQIQTAVISANRLIEVLDLNIEKKDEDNKVIVNNLLGDIYFNNISFRYGTRKNILNNITLNIQKGEKIALVGESGSGKTTLAKLLLRFYAPEEGSIFINDYDINDIQLDSLRSRIAYIPQEIFLYSGSIMDNLVLDSNDIDVEKIKDALKKAKAYDFVNELPAKWNTRLDENGLNLSGGQRQRLAIARALLRKPDIFILDEATSNLDSITEKAILDSIDEYFKGITTIIIAHKLSTIRKCNTIYVLDKGMILERGSHEELIKLGGHYSKLWREQTE